jgi:hypothetical protein
MDFTSVRKVRGDLFTDENIGVTLQGKTAFDPIMISDRLKRHSASGELSVQLLGLAIALGHPQLTQNPLGGAIGRTEGEEAEGPRPTAFEAVTANVYAVPLVRLLTVHEVVVVVEHVWSPPTTLTA